MYSRQRSILTADPHDLQSVWDFRRRACSEVTRIFGATHGAWTGPPSRPSGKPSARRRIAADGLRPLFSSSHTISYRNGSEARVREVHLPGRRLEGAILLHLGDRELTRRAKTVRLPVEASSREAARRCVAPENQVSSHGARLTCRLADGDNAGHTHANGWDAESLSHRRPT